MESEKVVERVSNTTSSSILSQRIKLFFPLFLILLGISGILLAGRLYFLGRQQQKEENFITYPPGSVVTLPISKPITLSPTPTTPEVPEIAEDQVKNYYQGKIAFVANGDIWTVNADRANLQQITNDEYNKFGISVSPDKQNIVYSIYAKDPEKRTNEGYYVGFYSGVAVTDLTTKKTTILIPYDSIQNHYATWSPSGKYVSVWVGNGSETKIIDAQSNSVVLALKGNKDQGVSPIMWLTSDEISYIHNGDLVRSNVDGSGKEVLAQKADSYRQVHEGPNVPQPPLWSDSGRYVAYYSLGGLHLLDVMTKTDIVLAKSQESEMFGTPYPQGYLSAYSPDETKLYLLDYSQDKNTVIFDIPSGKVEQIGNFGNSMITSPSKEYIVGVLIGTGTYGTSIYSLKNSSTKVCNSGTYDTGFHYSYYSWAGGFSYKNRQIPWSPDSKALLGSRGGSWDNIAILAVDNCELYEVVRGRIDDSVWIE